MSFVTANFDFWILKWANSILFIILFGHVLVSFKIFIKFCILINFYSSHTSIIARILRLFHEVTRLSVLSLRGPRERVCNFDKYNAITRAIFIGKVIFDQNIGYGDLGCIDDGAFALVSSENLISIFIQFKLYVS